MEIVRALVLDSSDSLSKALTELDESPAVIVTKNGGYFGIIDHRCISHGIRDPHKVKCETVIAKPPVLMESAGVPERVEAFLLGHFKALPVLDSDKKPLGLTTRVELLKEMAVESMVPQMQVSELMSSPAYIIDEGETVGSAKRTLREKDTHRLVVTRMGKLIGVVSTYDIGTWSGKPNLTGGRKDIRMSEPINVEEMKISEFLRPEATLVKENATLEEAVRRMIDKQVSTVIVVTEGKPVGVVSALDIFKKVQEMSKDGIQIQVSGLSQDDAAYFSRIYAKIGHVLEKFGESFNIRNASVHVKSGKSTYVVNVYFDTDDGHISLKTERGALKEGIDELAVEINEILRKKKELRKPKPRTTRAH
ncbi:CBS domain-containing protein [Candidatus Micrarchaeota archaeon]|nr:CBS domain-containing protein [Candidatus Micrarchaeota archaeon]